VKKIGDVAARHRAVQRFGFADLPRDLEVDRVEALGDRLGDLPLLELLGVELHALALDLLLVAVRGEQRELARQQVVTRVAVGDLHDFAAPSEVVHVLSENDFHSYTSDEAR